MPGKLPLPPLRRPIVTPMGHGSAPCLKVEEVCVPLGVQSPCGVRRRLYLGGVGDPQHPSINHLQVLSLLRLCF